MRYDDTKSNKKNYPLLPFGKQQKGLFLNKKLVIIFLYFLLLTAHCLLLSNDCSAEEPQIVITSDSLEYFTETKIYSARGSVEILKEGSITKADEITYYEETSELVAEGNVLYDDENISIKAKRAELNIDAKTGKLFDAEVFYKKGNYYLSGEVIEKRGENYYYSPKASFTTCDADVPAWCFKGKEVDALIGKRLKAKDVSLRIKDVPVLYTPYLWAPIITERQTGFLMPVVSYSKSRGLSLNVPFFWAISENRDATFILDIYSERGIGTGAEYRFIKPGGIKSNWWAYHIRDSELKKDFWEISALHENRYAGKLGGFLSINYVNEEDYYSEYSPYLEVRTQRFLESTGELNTNFTNSRLYLLSQYWVDLKYDNGEVPHKLPEAGYVLNYRRMGSFMFSSIVNAANLWREEGLSAGRIDVYPKLLYSIGKEYVVSQTVSLRGTAYSFYRNENIDDNSVQRSAFEYDIIGHTRLFRKYSYLTHVVEPSVRYHYISTSENDLPVFDSSELYKRTSRLELSVLNRIMDRDKEIFLLRITQGVEAYLGDRPFLPLAIEAGIKEPVMLKIAADYNVHTGDFETVSSDMSFNVSKISLSFGQRYNREEDIMLFHAQMEFNPYKFLQLAGRLWYDAERDSIRDIALSLGYLRQCWGINLEFTKKPGDFTLLVMFELTGISKVSKR